MACTAAGAKGPTEVAAAQISPLTPTGPPLGTARGRVPSNSGNVCIKVGPTCSSSGRAREPYPGDSSAFMDFPSQKLL